MKEDERRQKISDQKLSWNFRNGAKLHGNPDIIDVIYLSLRETG